MGAAGAMRADGGDRFGLNLSPAVQAGVVLAGGLALAAGVVLLAPVLFSGLLGIPAIAAIDAAWLEGLFVTAVFGLLALAGWLGLRLMRRSAGWGTLPLAGAAVGAALGIGGIAAALLLSGLAGVVGPGADAGIRIGALLGGTLAMLLQTASEELFFRGWLQPVVIAGWGRWPGLAATALGFAAVHFVSAAGAPLSLLNLTLAGLWLGLLAERSGGLALPIAGHFGWNWAEELLMGATPNPGVGNFGAVFDFDLAGNALWGGSGEALNASLSTSFVLAGAVVAAALWPGRWPLRQGPLGQGPFRSV